MQRSRVLVVEDMRFIAHFLTRTLEKAGYEARAVHHGDEVLAAVRAFRPHAVILDWVLPGMSGLEISQALRRDPKLEDLVIVIVTGHSFDDGSMEEVRQAGADWQFEKPVSPTALLAKLDELGVSPEAPRGDGIKAAAARAYEQALRHVVSHVPESVGLSVGIQTPEGVRWLLGDGVDCALGHTWKTSNAPAVILCAAEGKADLLRMGEALAASAEKIFEFAQEREGLSQELGVAYESLTSIYELDSDPALLLEPERALAKVVDHAVLFEPNLRAVLWIRQADQLMPVQWRGIERPEPRPADDGIAGRVLAGGRGIIFNRPPSLSDAEPELGDAHRVAAVPIRSGEHTMGVFVLWHESPGQFDSRVMGLLTSLLSHAANIFEQRRLQKQLIEGQRLRQEIEIGGNIQQSLLFGRVPGDLAGAGIGVVAEASRQVGGDFFEIFWHREGVFDVLVGDVMGKGIPAALVAAAVKSQFQRYSNTRLASGSVLEPAEPAEIVSAVHQEVAQQLIRLERFVTAIYARFDLDAGLMTYVDCGHTDVLHRRGALQRVVALTADYDGQVNLPLGFMPDTAYEQIVVPFAGQDAFLFYSDGFTEAVGTDGEMFGEEALAQAFDQLHELPAQALAEAVRARVEAFAAEEELADDLTCVAVRIRESGVAARESEHVLELPAVKGCLEQVRDLVSEVCREGGHAVEPATVEQMQLALTEAASNIVRHAYEPGEAETLRIEAGWKDGTVRFRVFDSGRAFDGRDVPAPRLDGTEVGGLGIYLMRQLMDDVRWSRDGEGRNCLVLAKRCRKAG